MKMSQEGEKPPLKIYANKPKKAHRKPIQDQHQIFSTHHTSPPPPPPSSSSSTMASQSSAPPQPPKESFARRYKFVWPLFLAANLGVGVYVLTRTTKKATDKEEEVSTVAQTTPSTEKPIPLPSVTEPVKVREPIPEHQQREVFKWILEEKRKVKPNNPEEKMRLDEEKAILKQFIRAKSIPSI